MNNKTKIWIIIAWSFLLVGIIIFGSVMTKLKWDFTKLFMDELGLPIVADNDVNSFAACECKMGAGKKYKTYIVMTVGTGIGGAIVVNNKLWRGKDYNAGEIGRMLVDGVHWEKMASVTSLIKSAKLRELDIEEGKDVFDLYDQGDRVAQLVVGEFYRNLGKGIANLVYIFNPEAIIIGGGISAREDFGNEINAYADYYLVDGFQDTVDIVEIQTTLKEISTDLSWIKSELSKLNTLASK